MLVSNISQGKFEDALSALLDVLPRLKGSVQAKVVGAAGMVAFCLQVRANGLTLTKRLSSALRPLIPHVEHWNEDAGLIWLRGAQGRRYHDRMPI